MSYLTLEKALEALQQTTDLLEHALTTHIFDTKTDSAVDIAASDESKAIARNRDLINAPKRLSVVGMLQHAAPHTILHSLHKTHQDVMKLNSSTVDVDAGVHCAIGDMTHIPSGIDYLVIVAPVPKEA